MRPHTDAVSYDRVPYRSHAFPQTHPDRLATVARLFALTPPDVARCRVLELGCASGGNIVPMACALPASEFVGVDFSRHQVDEGRDAIAALGLRNIRIECASIADVTADWGAFDYVICHGVFSWVDRAIQDTIFAILAGQLTPDGIAYVSYNTYPGWHMREMVRHMMRYHAGQFSEPQEQVDQARALLKFLASATPDAGAYGQLLKAEVQRLDQAHDSYLFHEHLERTNQPLYFHQFIERAEAAGLQYLAEAAVNEMLTSRLPAGVGETLERISPDILHLEQYLDFVRNRQFRQTLLCHERAKPKRSLTPDVLHTLLLSSRAMADSRSPDLSPRATVTFTTGAQRANVSSPVTKAALMLLMERWPQAFAFDDLCRAALERAARFIETTEVEALDTAKDELFGAVMHGMIDVHTQPPWCTNAPGLAPHGHPVALLQARSDNVVVNGHHDMLQLDPLALAVFSMCDGRHRREDMVDWLVQEFEAGRLTLDRDGAPVTDASDARAMLTEKVEQAMAVLTRSALLVS